MSNHDVDHILQEIENIQTGVCASTDIIQTGQNSQTAPNLYIDSAKKKDALVDEDDHEIEDILDSLSIDSSPKPHHHYFSLQQFNQHSVANNRFIQPVGLELVQPYTHHSSPSFSLPAKRCTIAFIGGALDLQGRSSASEQR